MSTATERRLLQMVDQALDLPQSERMSFLEREADGDEDLLARAHRLLLEAGPEPGEVETRIGLAIGTAAAAALRDHPSYPERIGPYVVEGVLGEGGMGVVLRARQDEPVSREVAIKLIRAGVHAPTIVARFQAERQTLATLGHPSIAKLHDAGTTPDGLPYFAMELIEGEPITDYCDRMRLDLDQRIALFGTLLDAVQHAHQRAIVHRDLKPSNVLVAEMDGRPVLKVIDFGIARVEGPERDRTRLTAVGAGGIGTLEYMSPEQLLQTTYGTDTRSDIYSLGVMLYELVSGRLPLDADHLRRASPSELERLLLYTTVPRASRRSIEAGRSDADWAWARRSDARTLRKRVAGDLDTIIEVAMASDPDRRYPTVARFGEDLERFLEGRPITARPRTARYRARKFVARNRYAVAASAAAAAVVVIMGATFAVRLARARDRATFEAEKAMQVAEFLESLFEAPDPASPDAADLTARELLDAGAERLQEDLAEQPELQSALLGAIGRTYSGLGLAAEAEALLTRALEVGEGAAPIDALQRAEILTSLGSLRSAAGDTDSAEALLEEALALRTAGLGADHSETAIILVELANMHRIRGDYEQAERVSRDAVALLRASTDSMALAEALHALAFALEDQGALEEAEDRYRESLAIRRTLVDPGHPTLLTTLNNLALLVEARGRYTEAEALSRQVLEGRRSRLGDEHPSTLQALNNLAYVLWRTGQYARASELFEEAVVLGERVEPRDSPTRAIGFNNLAAAKYRIGAYEEAAVAARRALDMDERLFGRPHPRVAIDMLNLGRTLASLDRLQEAESLHVATVAMQRELFDADHPDRADGLAALASTRIASGRAAEAVDLLEEVVRIRRNALGAENPRTAQALHDSGLAYFAAGGWDAAERRLREALDVRRAALGPEHPDVAATLLALGRSLRATDRFDEAREMFGEAGIILRAAVEPSDPLWDDLRAELAALDSAAAGG